MEPQKKTQLIRAIKSILIVIIIMIAMISVSTSYSLVHPPRRADMTTPSDYGLSYEAITFQSADGTELKGWHIPHALSSSLIIVCHGHGANKGDVLFAADFLHTSGYETLLFDFRAHGESGGGIATLGYLEPNDLKAAIDYAKSNFNPESIGVIGYSMGGATAITLAGQTSEIRALVVDSAFADRYKLVSKATYLPFPFYFIIQFLAELQGMNMRENLPIDYVDKISPNALLIIQGDRDNLVDLEDAVLLYEKAKEPKKLWIVEETPHVRAYFTHKQEYETMVLEFFSEHLKTNSSQ